MKTLLFFTLPFLSFFSFAQFSEGFFETLEPEISKREHFGGCITSDNGMLGVRFAINGNTEVQWVKMDEHGEYQFFSADLPQNEIPANENILEVFEENNFQYIITQDSNPDESLRGFHFYKYENYSNLVLSNFLPLAIRNTKTSVYLKYGKFYLLCNEINEENLKLLTASPVDLSLIQTQVIITSIPVTSIQYFSVGQNFIRFLDETNQEFYTRKDTNIIRIKRVNNQLQSPEIFNLNAGRLLGLNKEGTKLLLYEALFQSKKIKKYELDSTLTFDSEISLQNMNFLSDPINYLIAFSYGNNDLFINNSDEVYFYENNIKVDSFMTDIDYRFNKIDVSENKICLIGSKQINILSKYLLTLSKNEFGKLFDFKEYGGVYQFGDYLTHIGLGNNIFNDYEFMNKKDFIFKDMLYFSGQFLVGKQGNQLFGDNIPFELSSYKPGPFTDSTLYSLEIIDRYNENFYVTQKMLNEHVDAINNNDATYIMPKGIKNWPAHGDVSKGQEANLASFIDVNNNNLYEPFLGDYPAFPGTNCLLNITHQLESDFGNNGSGLELHTYMYNFECEDSIKDVIFIKTQVFNRGSINYDSLAFGISTDFDLGNYGDDYIGTNVENGLIYVYNGDLLDEQNASSYGFGDSLPSMATMFLKGTPFQANNIDDQIGVSEFQTVNGFGFSDGIIDNEHKGLEFSAYITAGTPPSMDDPDNSQSLFNYFNGKWYNGTAQVYGGTGYPNSSGSLANQSKYSFPDNSDPLYYGTYGIDPGFQWSEESNNNPSGDRRMLGSFGSTPLPSGTSITYHSAYLAGKRVPGLGQSQLDLFAKAAHVKKAFNSNLTSCGQTFDNLTQDQITFVPKNEILPDFKVYPNPMTDVLHIALNGNEKQGEITFVDVHGKVYLQKTLNQKTNSVSVSQLPKGFYIVTITSSKEERQYKLIKN